jgi:phage portal protein BeeE
VRRWEQRVNRDLFTPAESKTYFAEFMLDGLLRGDQASRYAAYAVGRQWGWLSANDVRRKENENPIENGDEYLNPMNMIPAGTPLGAFKPEATAKPPAKSGAIQ